MKGFQDMHMTAYILPVEGGARIHCLASLRNTPDLFFAVFEINAVDLHIKLRWRGL
jgi:hypothetical protein